MHIYNETTEIQLNNTAVTLGKFDGMHIGHGMLISQMMKYAKEKNLETVLFSFDTSKIRQTKSITTRQERAILCEERGIDNIIFYPVNEKTMAIEPEEFIGKVLAGALGAKVVVTGEDFHFGRGGRGNVDMLRQFEKQYGYELIVVEPVMYGGERVSSSDIKDYIEEGKIEQANEMLGYPFMVYGNVARGKQIGRTIGTRTVNVIPDCYKIMPINGVYKTKITLNHVKYKSITNVGSCPTVRNDGAVTVETHIFDFDGEIYDSPVKIEFEKFIRNEKKFSDLDALKKQISLDILQANL